MFYTVALFSLIAFPRAAISAYGELNPNCPVQNGDLPASCGPKTPRYCTCSPGGCENSKRSDGDEVPLVGMVDETHDIDIFFSEDEYWFYKQLSLDYTVEFLKNPTIPGIAPVNLPYCGPAKPYSNLGKRVPRDLSVKMLKDAYKKADRWIQRHDPFEDRPKKPMLPRIRTLCIPTTLYLPIHFSIFTVEYVTSRYVNLDALQSQVDDLNNAYQNLGISFYIASVHYHSGEQYRQFTQNRNIVDSSDPYYAYAEQIKQQSHYGGADEINVWVVESIDELTCKGNGSWVQTMGYCTQAWHLNNPQHRVDGCAIVIDSLTQVNYRGFNTPKSNTLIHEIGHWFGLDHTFATEAKCDGESDRAEDTLRFPMDEEYIFKAEQPVCCLTDGKWGFCPAENGTAGFKTLHNANWMSFSTDGGRPWPGDDPGAAPFTPDQQIEMFSNFFAFRRRNYIVDPNFYGRCVDVPVYNELEIPQDIPDSSSCTTQTIKRSIHTTRKQILALGDKTVDTLKSICVRPASVDGYIDSVSGELIYCDETGTCQPPPSGWSCLDNSSPPCTGYRPLEPTVLQACPDGSAPPCGSIPVCPVNSSLGCVINCGTTPPKEVTPPVNPTDQIHVKPDPSTVILQPGTDGTEYPPDSSAVCPKACPIHYNKCDATTAPTCIYPDPSAKNPRAACACRAGYKAGGYADLDATKQWRLPVVGQEYRVWVAEGVVCDTLCQVSTGVFSCQEVGMLDKACIG